MQNNSQSMIETLENEQFLHSIVTTVLVFVSFVVLLMCIRAKHISQLKTVSYN